MEITFVAKSIQKKIEMIEHGRSRLSEDAKNLAVAIAEYDKVIAVTIAKLRNGHEMLLDNERIKDPPATLAEKLAKGICWEAKFNLANAENEYKSTLTKLNCIQAELNGYQSIFRHLDVRP